MEKPGGAFRTSAKSNRRDSARNRRRLRVVLGTASLFTVDVSEGGFCVEAMRVLAPRTLVQGAIDVGAAQVPFSGVVAWSSAGDAAMNLRGRMGIRIVDGGKGLVPPTEAKRSG